jgi:Tfp pilus assembly protein PilP
MSEQTQTNTQVTINLNEFKEFVVFQYEQGKYKSALLEEVKALEEKKRQLKEESELVLELAFKRSSMGSDTRAEQTQIFLDGRIGTYFGFDKAHIELLNKFGFTINDLVAYINKQWDEKEASEKGDE